MSKNFFAPVSVFALAAVLAHDAKGDDLGALKAQLETLTKRIHHIEAEQKHQSQIDAEKHAEMSEKENQLMATVTKVELENEALRLASNSTVKSGSLPGSFLVPGTNTSLKLYGYAKMDVVHQKPSMTPSDSAGVSGMATNFAEIPLKGSSSHKTNKSGETGFSLRETRFGLSTQSVYDFGTVDSKVEGDFYGAAGGASYALRLRKAYVEVKTQGNEILLGQNNTIFADDDATADAELLDFGGILGSTGGRFAQIRYGHNITPTAKVMVALEEPETAYMNATGATGVLTSSKSTDRFPDFIVHARLGDDKAHVSFRALATQQNYNSSTYKKSIWGTAFAQAGRYTFESGDVVAYDAAYGKGLDGWVTGGSGAALTGTDATSADRRFFLQNNLGLSASYMHKWNETLRSTLALGMLHTYNKGAMKTKQANKMLRDIHINLIESPFKNLDVGVEYAFGQRQVEQGATVSGVTAGNKGHVHRFQVSAKYSF